MLHEPKLDPIEEVMDPSELNLFLFELLVLRVVFAGPFVAFLPSDLHIFIGVGSSGYGRAGQLGISQRSMIVEADTLYHAFSCSAPYL
jgi:hypothetical protein